MKKIYKIFICFFILSKGNLLAGKIDVLEDEYLRSRPANELIEINLDLDQKIEKLKIQKFEQEEFIKNINLNSMDAKKKALLLENDLLKNKADLQGLKIKKKIYIRRLFSKKLSLEEKKRVTELKKLEKKF